jgi:hypothetical protein
MDDDIPITFLSEVSTTRLDDIPIKILDEIQSSMDPNALVNRVVILDAERRNVQ